MPLHVLKLSVTKNTPAGTPLTKEASLSKPYITSILACIETPGLTTVGFRLTNNGATVAPIIGDGQETFIPAMVAALAWDEFKALSGPPYKVLLEAYNTDTLADHTLTVFIQTSDDPYYPVTPHPIPAPSPLALAPVK